MRLAVQVLFRWSARKELALPEQQNGNGKTQRGSSLLEAAPVCWRSIRRALSSSTKWHVPAMAPKHLSCPESARCEGIRRKIEAGLACERVQLEFGEQQLTCCEPLQLGTSLLPVDASATAEKTPHQKLCRILPSSHLSRAASSAKLDFPKPQNRTS